MSLTIMERVAEAKSLVAAITPDELAAIAHRDDVLVVDVRDHDEVAVTGIIEGAVHVTRGKLEFCADPASPFHKPIFSTDKTVVLYCQSGGRGSLCAKALLDLGYAEVRNLDGGFKAWVEYGGAVEKPAG